VPAAILDLAEKLAEKDGAASVQEYCSQLLVKAIEDAKVRHKVADFEARRGPLEGLKEIASDPDYLAEWSQRQARKLREPAGPDSGNNVSGSKPDTPDLVFLDEPIDRLTVDQPADSRIESETEAETEIETQAETEIEAGAGIRLGSDSEPLQVRIEMVDRSVPTVALKPTVLLMSNESALEILGRHVGWEPDDFGFLPCLRRGEAIPAAKVAELARALGRLEGDLRGSELIDRRTAHALHRLALESQVLLTDAWPGVFDEHVIAAIRRIQESVERILSGEDIRYYPDPGIEERPRESPH
jgi:hypothetical protein